MSIDRIATDNPKIFDSGWTGVPPSQYVSGCQFVEEGGVGVDALAFKDRGGTFHERDSGRVKVVRPRSRKNGSRVHTGNSTRQSLPAVAKDSDRAHNVLD
jgi:hypothetical protein